MLVLSRALGESFLINGDVMGTVTGLMVDSVELSLAGVEGRPPQFVVLHKGNPGVLLEHGVEATFVTIRGNRARIAFKIPNGVSFDRIEHVDWESI
ncbi:MAG: hypothetical protein HOL01_10975 [Planctomycetaceae bacterium]|nr:hypothetical protein [Planctomycetaceae bacterium]MBT6487942.1 hypothetical protein [Planctomycetaceae bacterium]MBT6495061.1 hypothetical protein [Planctomycetaceae bacterium]